MANTFDIYHLKYEVLLKMTNDTAIEVPEHLVQKRNQIVTTFKRLINKRAIRNASTENDPRKLYESWAVIGKAAKELLKNNWYARVASVYSNSAVEAIRATTSINTHWYLNGNKNIELRELASRSTAHFDIVAVEGRHYLYVLGSFYSIEDSGFVGALNEPQ